MPALYLLRHAEASGARDAGVTHDAERPLTDRGRDLTRRGAEGMKRIGLSFDSIFTSPFLRARQTGEIVASVLGLEDHLAVLEALASGAHWHEVRRALGGIEPGHSSLLVGHEPDLSGITARITGEGDSHIAFGTGTLAGLEVDAIPPSGPGVLNFLLHASNLASLSR